MIRAILLNQAVMNIKLHVFQTVLWHITLTSRHSHQSGHGSETLALCCLLLELRFANSPSFSG